MEKTHLIRSDDLRNENRRRVLQALRNIGPNTPSELAQHTGLSAASISSLSSQLSEQGIVTSSTRKSTLRTAQRGRPQTTIELKNDAADAITMYLSIDEVNVRRVNYQADVLFEYSQALDTRKLKQAELLDLLAHHLKNALSQNSAAPVKQVGVAFQGITESQQGKLVWSPIIQHMNIDLFEHLRSFTQLPVSVNNDSRLVSDALSLRHSDTLGESFATLLFSHGLGLGLRIDGKPLTGIRTSAMELGHLRFERNGALCRCSRSGCIEAYAADYGIMRMATGESLHEVAHGRVPPADIRALADAAIKGDEPAIQAYAIAGAAVGDGLATLFTLLDPMPVALVGRDEHMLKLMRPGLKSAFAELERTDVDIDSMMHCFNDSDELIKLGLTHNTLELLDSQLAFDAVQSA